MSSRVGRERYKSVPKENQNKIPFVPQDCFKCLMYVQVAYESKQMDLFYTFCHSRMLKYLNG